MIGLTKKEIRDTIYSILEAESVSISVTDEKAIAEAFSEIIIQNNLEIENHINNLLYLKKYNS